MGFFPGGMFLTKGVGRRREELHSKTCALCLCDAMNLTLQLKKTFDEGRPISEALSSFIGKRPYHRHESAALKGDGFLN